LTCRQATGRPADDSAIAARAIDPLASTIDAKATLTRKAIQAPRAARHRRARSSAPPNSEIYDGARRIGIIRAGPGAFAAFADDGRRLGAFPNVKQAMAAVTAAAQAGGGRP
jgi:hypothetical protein